MATIKGTKKQARKRHRQSLERRMRNKSVRTRVRHQLRKMRAAMGEGDAEQVKALQAQGRAGVAGHEPEQLHLFVADELGQLLGREGQARVAAVPADEVARGVAVRRRLAVGVVVDLLPVPDLLGVLDDYHVELIGADAEAIGLDVPDEAKIPDSIKNGEDVEESVIWDRLKTCYDPEIPVNVFDLGLIYGIDMDHEGVKDRLSACR